MKRKRLLAQIAFVVFFFTLLYSCYSDYLNLDKHYVVVDYQAQDIWIGIDNDGADIDVWPNTTDAEYSNEYVIGDSVYNVGDWFKVILNRKDPMHIVISVDENQTEKDRSVLVGVHRNVDGDTVRIIQEAKPNLSMD